MANDNNMLADPSDYDLERKKLARKRAIAEQLISKDIPIKGQTFGSFYVPDYSSMTGAVLDRLSGNKEMDRLDAQEALLSANEARNTADYMAGNPDLAPLAPGMKTSLRGEIIKAAGDALQYPEQRATAAAKAKETAAEKEANRLFLEEEHKRDRQNRLDVRSQPTIHISQGGSGGGRSTGIKAPSGYRYNEDGTALEPIPGGPADKSNATKPLTAKQLETQRGFMDLDSSIANYEKLLNGYDFQGASAASPKQRAALEGAYTDLQMKLKTLYDLGAPQAGDLKLLAQSIPNPVDLSGTVKGAAFGADPFKARLNETKKLLSASRQNFETQMGKQTPAAAGSPDIQPSTVVRKRFNPATGRVE